ncbi:MAG: hypothetical protein ACXVGK_10375, partial [Mycobacteriaceae bacterium]
MPTMKREGAEQAPGPGVTGGEMPKVSKATASSHLVFPGYLDEYEQEIGDWTVSIESNLTDMDYTPFFKGAPNDQCQ